MLFLLRSVLVGNPHRTKAGAKSAGGPIMGFRLAQERCAAQRAAVSRLPPRVFAQLVTIAFVGQILPISGSRQGRAPVVAWPIEKGCVTGVIQRLVALKYRTVLEGIEMGAKDILAELEEIGAIGSLPVPPAIAEESVSEITIERAKPSAALRDSRGTLMVAFCDRVVELLDVNIQIQIELKETFSQMRDLWSDGESDEELDEEADVEADVEASSETDDGPDGEEDEDDGEEDDEEDDEDGEGGDEGVAEEGVIEPPLVVIEVPETPSGDEEPVETNNAILDFYKENEAAGITLGVDENVKPASEGALSSEPGSVLDRRHRFIASLKADAEKRLT